MRWKEKKHHEIIVRYFFAWKPVQIKEEVRWLEFVKVEGYWWQGFITDKWYWVSQKFLN